MVVPFRPLLRTTKPLALALCLCLTLAPSPAQAQFNLSAPQSSNWVATQLSVVGLLGVASVAVLTDPDTVVPARWRTAPQFEQNTEENSSEFSARFSDVAVVTSWGIPVGTLYAAREGASYGNSMIIYGQALGSSLLVNAVTKAMVLRARPYTHNDDDSRAPRSDDNYSFYSGHSALGFTAGATGSALFSAIEENNALRATHWGVTMALASFTAHARVRAGRHYPTDVLVGSALGLGLGLAAPLLHGVPLQLSSEEALGAAGGILGGALLATALPRRSAHQALNLSPRLVATPQGMMLAWGGAWN